VPPSSDDSERRRREDPVDTAEDRSHRPGWLRYAPFLGPPPPLTRRQWSVIGLISIVTLFYQYDLALFSLALKQIQAELLIPEAQLGELGALRPACR
jgi:hypothetical protein